MENDEQKEGPVLRIHELSSPSFQLHPFVLIQLSPPRALLLPAMRI